EGDGRRPRSAPPSPSDAVPVPLEASDESQTLKPRSIESYTRWLDAYFMKGKGVPGNPAISTEAWAAWAQEEATTLGAAAGLILPIALGGFIANEEEKPTARQRWLRQF